MAVFEAVFSLILIQGYTENTVIDISSENRLGNISVKIGFEGKRFNPTYDGEDGMSPEMKILEGFADKISYSYHYGYNVIRISVRTTPRVFMASCGIGFLCAVATYLIINLFFDTETQRALLDEYLFPIETLFGNALLMIGPPVTLLSMLKNVFDVFIASERNADSHRLWRKALATSCFAIGLAMILCIILLAAIVTYGLCHASVYFDKLKTAIDACYELFSWMLRAVMVALPVFCFVAFLDALLDLGFISFLYIVRMVLTIAASTLILLATYAIRLRIKGVNVRAFVKRLRPLLRENVAIGSVIDAVPFNIRFCARNFGMNRNVLASKLPILAQLGLDGNCFLLMFIAMICIFMTGVDIPLPSIVGIALLVLFLELGAPNQPGGILVGTLIIISYLNLPDMLRMAIYLEVIFSSFQNLINVISNIVTVVEDEESIDV